MSDPFKGQPAKPQNLTPKSQPIKLANAPKEKGAHQISVEKGDGASKLPKK